LGATVGDRLIFRVQKPSALSTEASISQRADATVALPLTVAKILPAWPGEFSLAAQATPPLNAFLPIEELQRAIGREGRANLMLISWGIQVRQPDVGDHMKHFLRNLGPGGDGFGRSGLISVGNLAQDTDTLELVRAYLEANWRLEDTEAEAHFAEQLSTITIKSDRIFLDPPVVRAALAAEINAQPILTYLATLLRAGTNATPYSMVTAAGAPWTPAGLRDDEIVVSQWLADDLHVKPGDEIALSYFLPESGAKLEEATNAFRVHSIVPLEMPWADRTLMPDFPGIEKAESTRDWDAGFPLTYEVRKKDDDYWKQHRGTPKAFITLAAGQKMWGNRFGNLTAIRFPIPIKSVGDEVTSLKSNDKVYAQTNQLETPDVVSYKELLEKKILANLKPEELGLRFEPVREQALRAAAESQDFGGLFLGFSFFLIAAALLLMVMLFQFGLEQRAPEIGTLLALGFTPKQVRKLLLREGVALAFIGGVLGAIGGIYFAKAMLHGLTTVWRDAVGATALNFHVTMQTLVIGLFASVVVSAITLWLALQKFVKREPRELLAGEIGETQSKAASRRSSVIAIAALAAGLALVGWAMMSGNTANAGAFFGAGALVLIAGLGFVSSWLSGRTGVAPVYNSSKSSV
jgi:putative ABC transport system permease protein